MMDHMEPLRGIIVTLGPLPLRPDGLRPGMTRRRLARSSRSFATKRAEPIGPARLCGAKPANRRDRPVALRQNALHRDPQRFGDDEHVMAVGVQQALAVAHHADMAFPEHE